MTRDTFRYRQLSLCKLTFHIYALCFISCCFNLLLNDACQISDYACYVHFDDDILDTSLIFMQFTEIYNGAIPSRFIRQ